MDSDSAEVWCQRLQLKSPMALYGAWKLPISTTPSLAYRWATAAFENWEPDGFPCWPLPVFTACFEEALVSEVMPLVKTLPLAWLTAQAPLRKAAETGS